MPNHAQLSMDRSNLPPNITHIYTQGATTKNSRFKGIEGMQIFDQAGNQKITNFEGKNLKFS